MRISVLRMPFENLSDFQLASLLLHVVRTLLQNILDFLIGYSFNGSWLLIAASSQIGFCFYRFFA